MDTLVGYELYAYLPPLDKLLNYCLVLKRILLRGLNCRKEIFFSLHFHYSEASRSVAWFNDEGDM